MKKSDFNYISKVLSIVATILFGSTFLITYICHQNGLVFRTWISDYILYYRAIFLFTVLIIYPSYRIIKTKMKGLILCSIPVMLFLTYLFCMFYLFFPGFYSFEKYIEKDGQELIVVETTVLFDSYHSYYIPINDFLMKPTGDSEIFYD